LTFPESQFEPLAWAAVEGWQDDDHVASLRVFQTSCKPLVARRKWRRQQSKPDDSRPMRAALTEICIEAEKLQSVDNAAARTFFEEHFRPMLVSQLGEETGLLTGYYEPIIEGSRFPSCEYTVPVYAPPPNLVAIGRRGDGGAFPNKGKVGRRVGDKVVPFYQRSEIEEGVLAGQGLEICWVKDPIDAFFMQIQGSARVKLDTG
jgi:membrane-bound lytic murein transglycosylase A